MPEPARPPRWRPRPLLRTVLGDVLRQTRLEQRRTLADVARQARVSVPYLSEVERGRKEASSEVLAAVCDALRIALPDLLAEAGRGFTRDQDRSRADQVRTRPDRAGQDAARLEHRAPQPEPERDRAQVIGLAAARRRRDPAPPARRPGDVVLLAA